MSLKKVGVLLLLFGAAFINAALAAENVEYNIIAPDYIDVENNQTITGILSYTDVTDIYDAAPWGLDWGEAHAPYKWKVKTPNGNVTIGFERYETISTDPLNITFFQTTTEQIGNHTETRSRKEQQPISGVPLISSQATIQGTIQGTEWWNSAWQYRVDNQIPSGTRPYQLPLIVSNSAGINNATHIFLNGHAKPDLSDIRFTLNNATELSYWIENAATGKVWVRVPANGTVNMYYGNPSATDSSDGKATFEFFDDFSTLDLGANPVIASSQPWEYTNGLPKSLRWGSIAHLNGIYYIYYTNGAGITSDIGRATSTDLITWTKNPGNPVINDSIGPSLLKELNGTTPVFQNGKYWMITMKYDGSAIELRSAASIDSDIWTLENSNLIPKVPGWYENKTFTTSFVRENNEYHIFMEAKNNSGIYQVGHLKALSPGGPYIDQGVLLSPTFSWEGTNIMDPEIRKFGNTYYLFYTGGNDKPFYNNSYATSLNLAGPYTKTQIQVTPLSQTYPAISLSNTYYYILTDDHTPVSGTGKNLYRRNNLNGIFSSPFDWYKGGSPTVSGSELLINANGEYTRSIPAFLYKAMKVKAKYAPQTADNSYQYFGFTASSSGGEKNSTMFFSYENNLKAFSGNKITSENTSIYNPSYFGSYHNYEILWRQGESKFIIDDELKATQTSSVADIPLPVGMYDYGTSADLLVDWIFVRNYVSPEPAWATWGTESASSGGNPSSPLPNAPTYLITPTYDGSGEVVHPDMYYNATGWNGFKYWMAITPYPGGNDAFENPSILASNDGISWSVPAGLTNPIDPKPASGVNSDPDIVYNDTTNRLEVYYVEADGGSGGTSYLKRKTSTDGITWSSEQDIFNLTNYQIMSPGIIRKDGVYDMWYDDASSCSAATTYVKYRSSTDGITWSSAQNVNINQPGQNIWHLDVSYIPSKNEYWMIYAAYPSGSTCGNTDIYFAKSTDKINWITYDKKLMDRGSWDSDSIYRSTFLYDSGTDMLRVWYTAKGNNIRHIGYSERKYTDFLASLGTPSSGLVISNIAAATGKAYALDTLAVGKLFYIDRTYQFTTVPTSYNGLKYIKTATDDRYDTRSNFLQFDVNQDATVYVAYDDRITPKPSWLTSSFTDTGDDLVRDGSVTFSIYAKTYPSGHITLGGNSIPSGGAGGMYVVMVKPLGAPLPGALSVSISESPDPVISGGTSQVTVHVTSGGSNVSGATVDLSVTGGSLGSNSGTTNTNGDIITTYTAPIVTTPATHTISATASKTGYTSGSGTDQITVNPASSGLVISNIAAASGKAYVMDTLAVGKLFYIDRTYTFTSVPSSYIGLDYIKTAIDDRFNTGANFLQFDVNQDVTVYVAYDDRIYPKASWLSSFTDTGANVVRNGTYPYSIYARDYQAGHVSLGGNSVPSGGGGGMYVVIVKPLGAPLPGALSASISESPDPVTSGGTSVVTVHVSSGATTTLSGANVDLSVTGGNLGSNSGTTNASGDFTTTYTAPIVTTPTTHTISATASKTGYTSGSGTDQITVNPASSGLVISNIAAASGKAYVMDTLAVGKLFYIDRTYTFTSVPSSYIGLDYIKTAIDDRFNTGANFLQFDVNQDVTVYVAYDDRIYPKASWLSSFADTGANVVRNGTYPYSIYARDYQAGHVSLGGNSVPSGGGGGMYVVIVKPLGAPLPGALSVSISESPDPVVSGGTSVVTVHVSSGATTTLSAANVGLSVTGGSLGSSSGTTNVSGDFTTTYTAPTVTTPATHTISATASKTGYTSGSGTDQITVNPASSGLVISNIAATSGKAYVLDTLAVGKLFYIDRTYTFTSVPSSYIGLDYIKTAIDDRFNTGANFLQFDVNQNVTVYVAYDDRISPKASWLSSFIDTGANVVRNGTYPYSIYARDYQAGHVSLGGNSVASPDGAGGMYVVMVKP